MRLVLGVMLAITLGACAGPAPTHALIVRHPESKCALIAFSGCGPWMPEAEPSDEELLDEDAGAFTPLE